MTAFLEPGDEVILIEPYFDQYYASIRFQGAKTVFVPLHPPAQGKGIKSGQDWKIDIDEFRAAFSDKTKMVIVNTPHNPVGKVFTREELTKIAEVCVEKNVLVLADEVYDCMIYDELEHVRIATLPGMWERTLTVGSGGSESRLSPLYHSLADGRIVRRDRMASRMAHRPSPARDSHCRRPQPNRILHQFAHARGRRDRSGASRRAQILRGPARGVQGAPRRPVLVL